LTIHDEEILSRANRRTFTFLAILDRAGASEIEHLREADKRKMQGTHAALCRAAISDLKEQPQVGWFLEPVDAASAGLTDYHDKVKQPMDLSTVSMRLSFNKYESMDDFFKDVDLVFSNAIAYNPHTHDCYKAARELRARFKERYRIALSQHDQIMTRR